MNELNTVVYGTAAVAFTFIAYYELADFWTKATECPSRRFMTLLTLLEISSLPSLRSPGRLCSQVSHDSTMQLR